MSVPRHVIAFLWIVISIGRASCEYYTSISGMDVLLEAEGHLLNLRNLFMTEASDTTKEIEEEHEKALADTFEYISNPISAFKLIKRFVVDWVDIATYANSRKDLMQNLTKIMGKSFVYPTQEDLLGVAKGLALLQKTYGLTATDLSDGKILGTQFNSTLSVSDCVELGIVLFEADEYRSALPWLLEAKAKLQKGSNTTSISMKELLQFISLAYIRLGEPKEASLTIDEILQLEGGMDTAKGAKVRLKTSPASADPFAALMDTPVEKLCFSICSGKRLPTPSQQRPLRCMYTTNGIPYRLIGPFKVEQLSLDPIVSYYYEVITENEINYVIEQSKPIIKRSRIHGDRRGGVPKSEVRTSKTGWLRHRDVKPLEKLLTRLVDITGLSLETAESLQVVNYGIGGYYKSHYDFAPDPLKYGQPGNRMATAMFHLTDVELGGATVFPFLNVSIPPKKGGMALWYNMHGSYEVDFRTRHAGCPVIKGSKWILTEFINEFGQEFRKPCSLEQQGAISRVYSRQMSEYILSTFV